MFAHRSAAHRQIKGLLLKMADKLFTGVRQLEIAIVTASAIKRYITTLRITHLGLWNWGSLTRQLQGFWMIIAQDWTRLRDYAVQVKCDPNWVGDVTFDQLRAHFDEAQIVKLTWFITL